MSGIASPTDAEYAFLNARRRAALSSIFARVRGIPDELLSLQDAKEILSPDAESYVGRKTVKIELIVGSEERYRDFNRRFLPKRNFLKQRWKNIVLAHQEFKTLPPVLLYELGGLYFIRDGNHRVAVAKQRKIEFIEAEVTSLATDIEISPVATREELKRAVLAYEHDRFLELLPASDIRFTTTGRYDDLAIHIACHRRILAQQRGSTISREHATESWYRDVYLPIAGFIRESGVMQAMEPRTEADLYVWLVRHWDEIVRTRRRASGILALLSGSRGRRAFGRLFSER